MLKYTVDRVQDALLGNIVSLFSFMEICVIYK